MSFRSLMKYGSQNNNASVKLEMVPKIHFIAASVSNAGSDTANPVRKLRRHRAKKVFLTRGV